MKKIAKLLFSVVLALVVVLPLSAYASDNGANIETPTLKSISFDNAKIVGDFSPANYEYEIKLDDPNVTPTLKDYSITGANQIFVTKTVNEAGRQNGVNVEVKNDNVSVNYVFWYADDTALKVTSNNYLKSFTCQLGEVYPKLNQKDTSYTLYVPSDLTELKLSAITEDVGAISVVPDSIKLNADQNPQIDVSVTASDGSRREYSFQVKRVNKTCDEVKAEMQAEGYTSFIKGELFHQKPEFRITVISVVAGIVLIILVWSVIKRIAIKVEDPNETEFFEEN